MTKVVVGVATYRRPNMLKRLLQSIEKLITEVEVRVLVAENDAAAREGFAMVESLRAAGYRFALECIVVEPRGITYSRNAIIEAGFADPSVDFIAMADDDQWVEPNWLDELLKVQRNTGVDIVGAAVWPEFELPPPRWALESKVYMLDTTTTGVVDTLTGNGGILIARNFIKLLSPPWYDHEWAETGGEDGVLFSRLRAAGGRFARAADAIIHETFPASRMTLQWALKRFYRSGNGEMRVVLNSRSTIRFVKECAKIIAAFAVSPIVLILFFWSPGRRVDELCRLWRAAGKLARLRGSIYAEYTTIHGR